MQYVKCVGLSRHHQNTTLGKVYKVDIVLTSVGSDGATHFISYDDFGNRFNSICGIGFIFEPAKVYNKICDKYKTIEKYIELTDF
jgi:hypothetical protein